MIIFKICILLLLIAHITGGLIFEFKFYKLLSHETLFLRLFIPSLLGVFYILIYLTNNRVQENIKKK